MFNNTKPLIDSGELRSIVARLAREIENSYRSETVESENRQHANNPDNIKPPVLICALKGAFVFHSDLVKELDMPLEVDFLKASAYGERDEPTTAPLITKDIETNIAGRDVILVEDIIDRGVTLDVLYSRLKQKRPKSIALCALLVRDSYINREKHLHVDYAGKIIKKGFVVGYGMDYKERYRELRCIYNMDDLDG